MSKSMYVSKQLVYVLHELLIGAGVHIVLHVRHWLKLVFSHLIKHENHSGIKIINKT